MPVLRRGVTASLGNDWLYHFTVHVGQSIASPLVLESQSLVIDAQKMKNRGIQVMNVDRVLRDVISIVISFTVSDSGLDSRTRQPD